MVGALVFLLAVSSACSSTPSATSTGGAETPAPQRTKPLPAGADGFVFSGLKGVTLGRDEKAPDGLAPLSSADVELVAAPAGRAATSAATGKTDAKGFASFANVAAGLYRLRVKAPSGTTEFPLTLVGGATLRWGAYPVARERAFDIAKAQVASAIREDLTFIASPPTPLPAGVVVGPSMGNDDGEKDASLERKIPRPEWFFYVDPFTDQKFQHLTKFVFVDAESGAVTTKDASSWPALNGHSYYGNPDTLPDHPDALLKPPPRTSQKQTPAMPAPRLAAPIVADHVPGCTQSTTYALIIGGADEGPINADIKQIKDVFGHGGIPPASVRQWTPTPNSSPVAEVRALWDQIKAAATPCDHLFVFITAHGTRGGAAKLETDRVKDGIPVDFESFTASTLDWGNCRACHITIIIDACYSGRMVDQFKTIFTPLTGRKVVVMSSSDSRHESGSYTWYNLKGRTGGAFTNAFMDAFNDLAKGGATVNLGTAFDNANTAVASTAFTTAIRQQNPQYWERKLQPGETCAGLATATPTSTPTQSQVSNRPPKITRFYASFSRPVTTYTVEASDPDGDALTYAWSFNVTCGTTAGGNSTSATWSHPDRSIGGNCPDEPVHPGAITVTVTDGKGGRDSYTWTRGSDVGEVKP